MQFLATVALSDCGHLTLCGHKGLSDWVLLKNVIDKSVTVYDNGKSVTRHRLGVVGLNPTKFD